MIRIDIGKDFSLVTGGRRRDSGEHSAEAFRDDLLVPALRQGGQVIVSINGPSYSMAWLEEAFGTLQDLGFSRDDLSARLVSKRTATTAIPPKRSGAISRGPFRSFQKRNKILYFA